MPNDVIKHYHLTALATLDRYVYCKIQKGMYGLSQAKSLPSNCLRNNYNNMISFTLVIDDFWEKYVGKENAQHLLNTMRQFYKCSCNWDGKQYCGLTLKWDYNGQKFHLSMPNYNKDLAQFQHTPPQKRQDQPYPHVKPTYGAKKQYSQVEDNSPTLDKARKKFIQEVCRVFLYLAQAVNGGLLPVLSSLASQQANPTEKTVELCKQFFDYMVMQEDAILTYHASNTVLAIHSNSSYLSAPKSCSRMGGHMFMAGKDNILINNGAILNVLQIIQAIMSSTAEEIRP
jgi:hypothetical protein